MGSLSLARAVERRLGRAVFVAPSRAQLAVEGRVAPRAPELGPGYEATISVTRLDGSIVGTRSLESRDATCRELDEGVVLVIALLIDPEARPQGNRSRVAGPMPIESRPRGLRPRFGAFVFASLAQLPEPALGVAVSGALRHGARSLELNVGTTLAVEARDAHAKGSFRLTFGALSLCSAIGRATVARTELCGGAEVTRISASGLPFELETERVDFVSALARGRVALHLVGPLWAELQLWAALPLARPRFTYAVFDPDTLRLRERELFRVPALGGRAMLGLSANF